MSATIVCENCGQDMPIRAPADVSGARCPACGVVCDVPALDGSEIQAAGDAWSVSATPRAPAPGSKPRAAQVGDDDDQPYQIRDDAPPTEPCFNCRKPLPLGAIVCNHCGFNQETGETLQRIHQKVDRQWEAGLTFSRRFGIFLSIQGLALIATLIVAIVDGNAGTLLLSWMLGTFLLAFVFGTYPRVNLVRKKLGEVRLSKTWRFCFIPLGASDIRWRQYGGVVVTRSRGTDVMDWFILFLLAPWGLIPAFVWWHYVIEPDQFDVALTKDHGYPDLLLYRGRKESLANDIAATIRGVTGLP